MIRLPLDLGHLGHFALAASLSAAGCGSGEDADGGSTGGPDARRPNVLLIVVDTLRKDHLGCYGYERDTSPNLDRLAASGVRYERAQSQAPWTTPSLGALFSSQYPSTIGIRSQRERLADDLPLLAEVLDEAGYTTAGIVSHSFCSSDWGFDQGFDYFDESNVLGHAAVTSPGVTEKALSFLGELGQGPEPFFLWVHYFDPHCAYVEHEEHAFAGPEYEGAVESGMLFRDLRRLTDELGEPDVEELRRLYDSEIAYTDAQIGRVLDDLEARGLAEDTLVLFTADHGEEFLDHGRLGHAKSLHSELVSVPLVIRYPGRPPGVVDTPVGLIDLYPTVLDVLGLAPPTALAGVSIAPGSPSLAEPRAIFSETGRSGGLQAVTVGRHKLVRWDEDGRVALYDALDDPTESAPLSEDDPRLADLVAEVERFRSEVQAKGRVAPRVDIDAAAAKRLDDMGYAGNDEEKDDGD